MGPPKTPIHQPCKAKNDDDDDDDGDNDDDDDVWNPRKIIGDWPRQKFAGYAKVVILHWCLFPVCAQVGVVGGPGRPLLSIQLIQGVSRFFLFSFSIYFLKLFGISGVSRWRQPHDKKIKKKRISGRGEDRELASGSKNTTQTSPVSKLWKS